MPSDTQDAGLPPGGSATPGLKEGQETLAEVLEANSSDGSPDRGAGRPEPSGQHQSQQGASGSGFTPQLPASAEPSAPPGQASSDPAAQAAEAGASPLSDPPPDPYPDAVVRAPDPNAPSIPGLNPQDAAPYQDVPRPTDPNLPRFEGIPAPAQPGVPAAPIVIEQPPEGPGPEAAAVPSPSIPVPSGPEPPDLTPDGTSIEPYIPGGRRGPPDDYPGKDMIERIQGIGEHPPKDDEGPPEPKGDGPREEGLPHEGEAEIGPMGANDQASSSSTSTWSFMVDTADDPVSAALEDLAENDFSADPDLDPGVESSD